MSHYTMEVSGTIGLSDYSNIYDLYNRIYRIEKSLKDADEKSAK